MRIFKFYRIPDSATIDKILGENASIKFSAAFKLNDPNELKFKLSLDPSDPRHRTRYFEVFPEHSEVDFETWQDQVTENFIKYNEWQGRNTISHLTTMTSFAGNNNNSLMWSHYADVHQGICVEYDPRLIDEFKRDSRFVGFDQVSYNETPPLVDAFDETSEKTKKMFFNKQSEWA